MLSDIKHLQYCSSTSNIHGLEHSLLCKQPTGPGFWLCLRVLNPHAGVSREQLGNTCGWHIYRYRVVSRVVYADQDPTPKDLLHGQRDAFLEMLLTAIWLYKDFPDVELWVSLGDEPSRCDLHVPILQYTILNTATVEAAAGGADMAYIGGVPFSIPHLLTGEGHRSLPRQPGVNITRGPAFSHPGLWDQLSMLPSELRMKQLNMSEKAHGQPRRRQIIWRGGNTGFLRGWPPAAQQLALPQPINSSTTSPSSSGSHGGSTTPGMLSSAGRVPAHPTPTAAVAAQQGSCGFGNGLGYDHPWAPLLLNKRTLVTQVARYHADIMDIGLHEVLPYLLPKHLGGRTATGRCLRMGMAQLRMSHAPTSVEWSYCCRSIYAFAVCIQCKEWLHSHQAMAVKLASSSPQGVHHSVAPSSKIHMLM